MKVVSLFILLSLCIYGQNKNAEKKVKEDLEKDEVTLVKEGNSKMNAAIAKARNTVDEFIKVLKSNDPKVQHYSIKAPLKDGDQVEHVWLVNLKVKGDKFTGAVGNKLQIVKNYKMGQAVTINKKEITDWMYVKDKVVYGNVTLKALFHTMDPEEVKVLKKMMGWDK